MQFIGYSIVTSDCNPGAPNSRLRSHLSIPNSEIGDAQNRDYGYGNEKSVFIINLNHKMTLLAMNDKM